MCHVQQHWPVYYITNSCNGRNGSCDKRMSLLFFSCHLFWSFLIDGTNFVQIGHFFDFKIGSHMLTVNDWWKGYTPHSLDDSFLVLSYIWVQKHKRIHIEWSLHFKGLIITWDLSSGFSVKFPHFSFLVSNIVSNLTQWMPNDLREWLLWL